MQTHNTSIIKGIGTSQLKPFIHAFFTEQVVNIHVLINNTFMHLTKQIVRISQHLQKMICQIEQLIRRNELSRRSLFIEVLLGE